MRKATNRMKIRKSVQILMPFGVELILQGETTGQPHIKLSIRKKFDTKREMEDYAKAHLVAIKKAMCLVDSAVK